MIRALLASLALALLLVAGPARARGGELEEALPADTVLVVKFSNWTKTRDAIEKTALGRILAEKDVKTYLAGFHKVMDDFYARLEKATGLKKATFEKAYGTEIAMVSLAMEKGKGTEEVPGGESRALAATSGYLARVGDPAAARQAEAAIRKVLVGARAGTAFDWGGVKGVCVKRFVTEPSFDLYCFRAGAYQAWFFASGADVKQVKELAAALAAGKREKSLAASADYKLCRKQVGAGADLFCYLGTASVVSQVRTLIPETEREKFDKFMKIAGADGIRAVARTVSVEPPGFRTRSFAAMKPGKEGLLGLVGTAALPAGFLKLVPSGATMAVAGSGHPDRILPAIRKIMVAVDEKRGPREFDQFLKGFKRELGFDLKEDLLDALGERYCYYILPPGATAGNPMMAQVNGMVLAVEVKDAAKMKATAGKFAEILNKMLGMFDPAGKGPVTSFEYRKQKLYSVDIEGMANPGFAVTGKYLLLGGNVAAVKRTVTRLAAGDKAAAGLLADEKFKKAAGRVKTAGACAISYHHAAKDVSTVLSLLDMLRRELRGELERARDRNPELDSMSKLANINQACRTWADDHDGKFPAKLDELCPEYLTKRKQLVCPDYGKHAAGGVDYAYVAGLKKADKGDYALAYESVPAKDGTVNALFLDGRVQNLALKELKKQLAAQRAALAKAGRKLTAIEPAGAARGEVIPEVINRKMMFDLLIALVEPRSLPAAEGLAKHLFPSIAVTRKVEGGLLSESFSPAGFALRADPVDAAGIISLAAAASYPAMVAARRSAKMVMSKSNLRQIGLACHMWADDNDEIFPKKDLNTLVPNYIDNRKVFLCPHYAKHATDGIDYAYITGLRATDRGSWVMGYEVRPGNGGKVNVLFCDAHVEAMTPIKLKRLLARQFGKMKSAGRKYSVVEPKGLTPVFKAAKIKPVGVKKPK